MKCINEKIGMQGESYYWREERIEIVSPFFSLIKNQFPEVSNGQPIADAELKDILPFIIENGYLEKVEPSYNNGFNYRYTQILQDEKLSAQDAKSEFEKIMSLVNDYSDIYTDLIELEHKWQIKKFMSAVVSYDWLPKKYWY